MRILASTAVAIAAMLGATTVQAQPVARFAEVTYQAAGEPPAAPPDSFRNPILPGFHPDPSITRVGDDFYLVTSTFSWFPGLPVFHSRDLVNWKFVSHAIDRPGQVDFRDLGMTRGLFAPAITHHAGKFYIVNTCVDCGGNFYVTADRAEGPWSDPVWLDFEGIDPSLFFDDDGTAWMVNNGAPAVPERYEGHRALWIQQFDPAAGKLVGPRKVLVDGGVHPEDKPIWAEGPHIYKVGDWYYLMAAEGGTAEDHSETIYRSRKVDGPYEAGPNNPILTQRNMAADRPDRVEATGHADLVQLDDGTWWGAFLATRPFAGQSTLLGRETWLLPVHWQDGWPYFLKPGETVPVTSPRPNLPQSPGTDWSRWSDSFDGPALSPEWLRMRSPRAEPWFTLGNGELALTARPDTAGGPGQPSYLGKRLRHPSGTFETRLDFTPEKDGDFAGLLALIDENHFLAFGVEQVRGKRSLVVRKRNGAQQAERGEGIAAIAVPAGAIALRVSIDRGSASLAWKQDGGEWQAMLGDTDVEFMSSIHAGLFTGVLVGPYAVSGG